MERLETISEASGIANAIRGSLFLSNVGELSSPVQARLARIVRDGEVQIDSSSVTALLDVRFIASTLVDLDGEVREGCFREDLCQRLVLRLDVPPVRHRTADIPTLVSRFAADVCRGYGAPTVTFSEDALALLSALPWRGDLQELRQVVERMGLAARGGAVGLEDVLAQMRLERSPAAFLPSGSLREARARFERDYIAGVLHRHEWRMGDAARALGIQRTNLYRKTRQLGLVRTRIR